MPAGLLLAVECEGTSSVKPVQRGRSGTHVQMPVSQIPKVGSAKMCLCPNIGNPNFPPYFVLKGF